MRLKIHTIFQLAFFVVFFLSCKNISQGNGQLFPTNFNSSEDESKTLSQQDFPYSSFLPIVAKPDKLAPTATPTLIPTLVTTPTLEVTPSPTVDPVGSVPSPSPSPTEAGPEVTPSSTVDPVGSVPTPSPTMTQVVEETQTPVATSSPTAAAPTPTPTEINPNLNVYFEDRFDRTVPSGWGQSSSISGYQYFWGEEAINHFSVSNNQGQVELTSQRNALEVFLPNPPSTDLDISFDFKVEALPADWVEIKLIFHKNPANDEVLRGIIKGTSDGLFYIHFDKFSDNQWSTLSQPKLLNSVPFEIGATYTVRSSIESKNSNFLALHIGRSEWNEPDKWQKVIFHLDDSLSQNGQFGLKFQTADHNKNESTLISIDNLIGTNILDSNRRAFDKFVESTFIPNKDIVKVMTVGDSITRGWTQESAYRYHLWRMLQFNNYTNIDFVGPYQSVENSVKFPDTVSLDGKNEPVWDIDHAGLPGWTAFEYLRDLKRQNWANTFQPDIVLIHLGTNGDLQSQINNLNQESNNFTGLIEEFRSANSEVTIVIAQISHHLNNQNHGLRDQFNQKLLELESLSNDQSKILVVDQYSGFNAATHTFDDIHMNEAGGLKLARNWYFGLTNEMP